MLILLIEANEQVEHAIMNRRSEAKLSHEVIGDTLHVRVCGDFSYVACAWFDAIFSDEREHISKVVLDCHNMAFMDSTAVGMLLYVRNQLGDDSVRLTGTHGAVYDSIRRMGFHLLFACDPAEGAATGASERARAVRAPLRAVAQPAPTAMHAHLAGLI